MSPEIVPLISLIAMFVIATIFPINIGFLGFVGAFAVGALYLGLDDKEVLEAFPSHIVLTVIGSRTSSAWPSRTGRST